MPIISVFSKAWHQSQENALSKQAEDYMAFLQSGWEYDWEKVRCVKGGLEFPLTPACHVARRSEKDYEAYRASLAESNGEDIHD